MTHRHTPPLTPRRASDDTDDTDSPATGGGAVLASRAHEKAEIPHACRLHSFRAGAEADLCDRRLRFADARRRGE